MSAGSDQRDEVWRKSTRSMTGDNNCVEVAVVADTVFVRDSKDDSGATLAFPVGSWRLFIAGVKAGEFSPKSPTRPATVDPAAEN